MKKLGFLFSLLVFSYSGFSQTHLTNYSKGTRANFCGEEKFTFIFNDESITRVDAFNGSREKFYSKKESGIFDNNGHYSETWSARFYLDRYGINEFNKIKQYTFRVVFDKRGGTLLYILEFDNKKGIDLGKVYLSQAGYELVCR